MAIRLSSSEPDRSGRCKALMIGAIVLLLLIPLIMLRGLVSERSSLREQAYVRVAEGWGGGLTVGGPMLVIPTERTVTRSTRQDAHRAQRSSICCRRRWTSMST